MDAHEFAKKYSRLRAVIEWREVDGERVEVVFLQRCPKCGYGLPGMLDTDGFESCIKSKCDYRRHPSKFYF